MASSASDTPPATLELTGKLKEQTACLGLYALVPGRKAHGWPVWKHGWADRWIAATSGFGTWMVQEGSCVGKDNTGWLELAGSPPFLHSSKAMEWAGAQWVGAPSLKCVPDEASAKGYSAQQAAVTKMAATQVSGNTAAAEKPPSYFESSLKALSKAARKAAKEAADAQLAAAIAASLESSSSITPPLPPRLQEKAVKEEEDAQIAAAIAASLELSGPPPTLPMPHPVARVKRWGDGLEAPAAGWRDIVPQGFVVTLDVSEAIGRFGHSASQIANIMSAGRAKASTSPTPLASAHAAALYAFTEETQLYGTLNYAMRTPHTLSTPTDTELKRYCDYVVHTERALSNLPAHVSELQGKVYRGIKAILNPDIYAPGKRITWQAFSSSTKKQTATLDFINVLPGRKLLGSLFVIDSITAKDIRHFSALPSEEEVLFPPNSQFKVEKVVMSEQEKKALLNQLGAYDMADLDVYMLKQIA